MSWADAFGSGDGYESRGDTMTRQDAHFDPLIHQRSASAVGATNVSLTGRWHVGDVMSTRAVAVGEHTRYQQIAALLQERRQTAVPVVTPDRRVIGVVSEADLLRKQERHAYADKTPGWQLRSRDRTRAEARTAQVLMTSPVVTIGPDELLGTAARVMSAHHVRQLPVVRPDGTIVGLVSRKDLLSVYLRPDEELVAEAVDLLTSVVLQDPAAVRITASEGVVTVLGRLPSFDQVETAVRLIEGIDGVVSVTNKLHAPPPENWPGAGYHIPTA
jgi:CBS-domain-containing membrane protein